MTLPADAPVLAWPNLDTPQYGAVNTRTKTLYTPVSSGGSWSTGTPLTNLPLPYRYQRVIRSTDAAMASTRLVTDFGRQVGASVFALPGHTMTPAVGWSQWRVRWATTDSFPANLVADPDDLTAGTWAHGGTGSAVNEPVVFLGRNFTNITNVVGFQAATAVTLTGNGTKRMSLDIHSNGPMQGLCVLFDQTASNTVKGQIEWTVNSDDTVTGSASVGTYVSTQYLGSGVYRLTAECPSCIGANTHAVYPFSPFGAVAGSVRISRVRVEDMPATVVVDSLFQNAFQPAHDAASFPAGWTVDSNAPTLDDLLHMQALSAVYVNPTVQQGRYRLIEIDDTTNTDGFIELTAFTGPGYFFPTGANVGAALQWKDATTLEQNDFGIRRYNEQGRWRECQLTQGMLTQGQAIWPYRMEGRLGISQELFFALAPTEGNYLSDWSFLCTLAETSGVSYAASCYLDKGHKLVEKI